MSNERLRVDTSFSAREFRKTLTGESDVEIDLSKITISPSGQVQPADFNGQAQQDARAQVNEPVEQTTSDK